MYAFETAPAFRGATYMDAALLVDENDGTPMALDPGDAFTWRLLPASRIANGCGFGWACAGWDYGFQPSVDAAALLTGASIVTLTLGQGLAVGTGGAVQWLLTEGQTLLLRRPEYRMTLDLVRQGQTARILDTLLQVMD